MTVQQMCDKVEAALERGDVDAAARMQRRLENALGLEDVR